MAYGHSHGNANLPTILAGGKALGLKHGAHVDFNLPKIGKYNVADASNHYRICSRPVDDNARLSNLLLTMLQRMDVETEPFQDSVGTITGSHVIPKTSHPMIKSIFICHTVVISCLPAWHALRSRTKFRTDGGGDKSLPWFQLEPGKFPPADSAHAISGELIQVDHLERRFRIRVDRNDSQQAGHMDLPLEAAMLPYGSLALHGAPAALQDIPLGTHLHGLFYLKDPNDKSPPPLGPTAD